MARPTLAPESGAIAGNTGPIVERWRCRVCGQRLPRWAPLCPMCHVPNSLMFRPDDAPESAFVEERAPDPEPEPDDEEPLAPGDAPRMHHDYFSTGYPTLDAALGHGWAYRTVVLCGGKASVGKTTLVMGSMQRIEANAMLASAEQMRDQVTMIAQRIGATRAGFKVMQALDVETALEAFERHDIAVGCLDSVQRFRARGISGRVGTPTMVQEVLARGVAWARGGRRMLILLSHATKAGDFMGSAQNEHDVDVTLKVTQLKTANARRVTIIKSRIGRIGGRARFAFDSDGALLEAPLVRARANGQAAEHADPGP